MLALALECPFQAVRQEVVLEEHEGECGTADDCTSRISHPVRNDKGKIQVPEV